MRSGIAGDKNSGIKKNGSENISAAKLIDDMDENFVSELWVGEFIGDFEQFIGKCERLKNGRFGDGLNLRGRIIALSLFEGFEVASLRIARVDGKSLVKGDVVVESRDFRRLLNFYGVFVHEVVILKLGEKCPRFGRINEFGKASDALFRPKFEALGTFAEGKSERPSGERIDMPIPHVLFKGAQIVAGDVEEMDAFFEIVLMGAEQGPQLVGRAIKPLCDLPVGHYALIGEIDGHEGLNIH